MEPAPLEQIIDFSSEVAAMTAGALGIGLGIAYRLAEAGAAMAAAD